MIKRDKNRPVLQSEFRTDLVLTPEAIRRASGIIINGRRYKSFLFSSDVATIMYTDADAILAVYPYTPHPSIIKALSLVAPSPLVAGVGGGVTQGKRSVNIALFADAYNCTAVVLNAAASAETLKAVYDEIDIPIVYTVISEDQDISEHITAGASILNISGGKTPLLLLKKCALSILLFQLSLPVAARKNTYLKQLRQVLTLFHIRHPLREMSSRRIWINTGKT